ncbi:MAG: methyltransferase domain-containing protein [Pirellulales bacterium]|nr:methyltransferase domain-containing protein [Pirellulales bacterium]
MAWLDDKALEVSEVVANSTMNRERNAVGPNSYEKELRLSVVELLAARIASVGEASWLDLCCGRGKAIVDVARHFQASEPRATLLLHGVDLVDLFCHVPPGIDGVRLEAASLNGWTPERRYDLITCVHGLHYMGDKLGLIERAADWLSPEGLFLASLDLQNFRYPDGRPLGRQIARLLRDNDLHYNTRQHLLTCEGPKTLRFDLTYLGADDTPGPNYSGQPVVDSIYDMPE